MQDTRDRLESVKDGVPNSMNLLKSDTKQKIIWMKL